MGLLADCCEKGFVDHAGVDLGEDGDAMFCHPKNVPRVLNLKGAA